MSYDMKWLYWEYTVFMIKDAKPLHLQVVCKVYLTVMLNPLRLTQALGLCDKKP